MDEMPVTPGSETSEGFIAKVVTYASLALAIVGILIETLVKVDEQIPGQLWIGKVLAVLGVAAAVLTSVVYGFNRTSLKKEAIRLQGEISSKHAVSTLKEKK